MKVNVTAGDLLADLGAVLQQNRLSLAEIFVHFAGPAGLGPASLGRYFQMLLDTNGDSSVTLEELSSVLRDYAAPGNALSGCPRVRLEDALLRLAHGIKHHGVRQTDVRLARMVLSAYCVFSFARGKGTEQGSNGCCRRMC